MQIPTDNIERALAQSADRIAPGQVGAAMRYAIEGGGKRLRPALVTASYEAVARRAAGAAVFRVAAAVELIHTYSLIHDDLPCMDDDDIRRGRPTTHRAFGDDVAAAAGAALIPLAFSILAEAAGELGASQAEMAATLAAAAGARGMVGGQVLDLEAEGRDVELESLERIHQAKTGALLIGACRLGGLAAGASESQLEALGAYARHLGLAFQITDDILDETASTDELGKTAGKDRTVAKATYPALLGVRGATERAVTEMTAALEALHAADVASDALAALCRFAVERKR